MRHILPIIICIIGTIADIQGQKAKLYINAKEKTEIILGDSNKFFLSVPYPGGTRTFLGNYKLSKTGEALLYPIDDIPILVYGCHLPQQDSGTITIHIDNRLNSNIKYSNETDHLSGHFSQLYYDMDQKGMSSFTINKFYNSHIRIKYPLVADEEIEKTLYRTLSLNYVDSYNNFLILPKPHHFEFYSLMMLYTRRKFKLIDQNKKKYLAFPLTNMKRDTSLSAQALNDIIKKEVNVWNLDTLKLSLEVSKDINSILYKYEKGGLGYEYKVFKNFIKFISLASTDSISYNFNKIQVDYLNERVENLPMFRLMYSEDKTFDGLEKKLIKMCEDMPDRFKMIKKDNKIINKKLINRIILNAIVDQNTDASYDLILEYYDHDKIKIYPVFKYGMKYLNFVTAHVTDIHNYLTNNIEK